jgi:hypothetical protein
MNNLGKVSNLAKVVHVGGLQMVGYQATCLALQSINPLVPIQ